MKYTSIHRMVCLPLTLVDIDDGTNAVVVMCTDERTCKQLRDYLQFSGTDGFMRRKLKEYFAWKSNFQKTRSQLFEKKPENEIEDGISWIVPAHHRRRGRSKIENEEKRCSAK